MKALLRTLLLPSALLIALASWPGSAAAHTCNAPFTTDLVAYQDNVVGTVEVCNDDTDLHVTYVIEDDGWCLDRTNLAVGNALTDIPPQTRKGKPLPARFPYKAKHQPCVSSFPVQIALGAWVPDTPFVHRGTCEREVEGRAPKEARCLG